MNLSFLFNMSDALNNVMRITKEMQEDVGYEVPAWACVVNPGQDVTYLNYLPLDSRHQKMALERATQNMTSLARGFANSFPSPENISLYVAVNADHSFTIAFDEKVDGVVTDSFHINRYALDDALEALTAFEKEAA
jgi:hypothetical protein